MSFPCPVYCGRDETCDVSTKTCFPCFKVCLPTRGKGYECKRDCPDYVLPTTTSPPVASTSDPWRPGDTDTDTVISPAVTVGIASVLPLIMLALAGLGYWCARSRRRRDRRRHPDANTVEVGHGQPSNLCFNCGNLISVIAKPFTGPGQPPPATMPLSSQGGGEIKGSSQATSSTKLLTGRNDDASSLPSGSSRTSQKFSSGSRGVESGVDVASVPPVSQPKSPGGDTLRMDTLHTPPLQSPDPVGQSLPETINYHFQSGPNIALRSDGGEMDTTESGLASVHAGPSDGNHWRSVMKVYDIVDQRLHEMSWIAGCMISNTALWITAKSDPTEERRQAFKQKLRNVIPSDIPSERYVLTFEGPALQATSGTFGSGSLVHVSRAGSPAGRSTVTVLGRCGKGNGRVYRPATYTFTAGHVAHRGDQCEVKGGAGGIHGAVGGGRCLAHIDTVQESHVRDIKHKIYDLALIEMEQSCSVVNSRVFEFNGHEITLKVEISKRAVTPMDLHPGKKVLIFGGPNHKIIEASIDARAPCYTCKEPSSQRLRQTVNLIQLDTATGRGQSPLLPGHSGSLVVWAPTRGTTIRADNSLVVQAFAVVIGVNAECPEKGFAVPLWEQIQQLFRTDARFIDLKEHMRFEDYLEESGFFTSV